jgi:hypothetical protein
MQVSAEEAKWTVSDILISPKTESYVVYSTLSGVLHLISTFFIFPNRNFFRFEQFKSRQKTKK